MAIPSATSAMRAISIMPSRKVLAVCLAPCPEQECATSVPLKLWEQLLDQERFETTP